MDKKEPHKKSDDISPPELEKSDILEIYAKYQQTYPGSAWFRTLYDLFAPVRQAVAESGMTSDEIDQLLDEELAEVRRMRNP